MDRVHSGNVWAAFLSCFVRFSPVNGVRWPDLGGFGSGLRLAVRKRKVTVSAWTDQIATPGAPFPPADPYSWWFPTALVLVFVLYV